MDKATVLGNLTRFRQAVIADRTQRKQEKKYVVESGRPFLSFKKRGSSVVVSGNIESVRRIKEAGPVLEFLEEIMLGNDDLLDQPEYVTNESEDPASFIPKLWCQIGDKANGWGVKQAEKMAQLLLTIMDAGQGGSITLSNKTKPRPMWFNKDANWSKYTQPSSATLEENTDVIKGIFQFHGLDPRIHNLRPINEDEEKEEVEDENMDQVNCDEEDGGDDTAQDTFARGKSLMGQKMLMRMRQIETTMLNLQNPLKMQFFSWLMG